MRPIILMAVGAAAVAAYMIYENVKTNPQATFIDGWQSTGRNRRTDVPPPPAMVDAQGPATGATNS